MTPTGDIHGRYEVTKITSRDEKGLFANVDMQY